jgi:glucosylglycerate synthase
MTMERRFSTALRNYVREKIERLGQAELVIGIPAYHSEASIEHVIKTICRGLDTYFHGAKAVIIVADGGSTDDTRDVARSYDIKSYNIEKIVSIYRGIPGKGSALRAIFEVANFLRPSAVAVFDSDLVSITPEWIRNLLEPVQQGYDFVAPDYNRYKLDATITNTIAYNLTRALYGARIRQPIGGDFSLSLKLTRHYLDQQDVWETDVARFGIDIWMTTIAIVNGFNMCQTKLGAKVHGKKDPAADLGPMYRQVVGTIFQLMEMHAEYWMKIKDSSDIPSLGAPIDEQPAAFAIDQANLIEYFKIGFWNFGTVWQQIIEEKDIQIIKDLAHREPSKAFNIPIETWVRMVYRYANAFHATPRQRFKLLDTMTPLYYARVASLVDEVKDMNQVQAEQYFDAQARTFEDMKAYLINLWERRT